MTLYKNYYRSEFVGWWYSVGPFRLFQFRRTVPTCRLNFASQNQPAKFYNAFHLISAIESVCCLSPPRRSGFHHLSHKWFLSSSCLHIWLTSLFVLPSLLHCTSKCHVAIALAYELNMILLLEQWRLQMFTRFPRTHKTKINNVKFHYT